MVFIMNYLLPFVFGAFGGLLNSIRKGKTFELPKVLKANKIKGFRIVPNSLSEILIGGGAGFVAVGLLALKLLLPGPAIPVVAQLAIALIAGWAGEQFLNKRSEQVINGELDKRINDVLDALENKGK